LERLRSALHLNSEDPNSFFSILKREHAMVKDSLERILNARTPMRDLFAQTASSLDTHMRGEEELLYPKLKERVDTRQMAFRAYEEHDIGKRLVAEINTSTDGDQWLARVRVLLNTLKSHIDFEEDEVFPRAKDILYQISESNLRSQYTSPRAPTAPAPPAPPQMPPTPPTA